MTGSKLKSLDCGITAMLANIRSGKKSNLECLHWSFRYHLYYKGNSQIKNALSAGWLLCIQLIWTGHQKEGSGGEGKGVIDSKPVLMLGVGHHVLSIDRRKQIRIKKIRNMHVCHMVCHRQANAQAKGRWMVGWKGNGEKSSMVEPVKIPIFIFSH